MTLTKKNIAAGGGVVALLGFFFVLSMASGNTTNPASDLENMIKYSSRVCIQKNDDPASCSSNLLYTSGRNLIKESMGNEAAADATDWIALCNSTISAAGQCDDPVIAGSETFVQFDSCGMANVSGTYASNGDGNWSISNTFTSTCDGIETNFTRLQNANGDLFAGNTFEPVTLQTNDQLTVNWTAEVT